MCVRAITHAPHVCAFNYIYLIFNQYIPNLNPPPPKKQQTKTKQVTVQGGEAAAAGPYPALKLTFKNDTGEVRSHATPPTTHPHTDHHV